MIMGVPYDAEIAYLESTGTQYIDTGYKSTPLSKWEADFQSTKQVGTNAQSVFGACGRPNVDVYYDRVVCNVNQDNASAAFYLNTSTTSFGTSINTTIAYASVADANDRHVYGIDVKRFKCYLDNTTYTGNPLTGVSLVTDWNVLLLVRRQNSQYTGYASGKLFGFKHWEDDVLVQDLIPVRVGNVGYMYDRVTGRLFGNAGTGSFVLGPDVARPVMGLRDYPQSIPNAREYVMYGLIRQLDSIETTGYGQFEYTAGTILKNLATGVNSGAVVETNISRNGKLFTVNNVMNNIVFKDNVSDVSAAFASNRWSMEFCGSIPYTYRVGTYDQNGNSYRLNSIQNYDNATMRFWGGSSSYDLSNAGFGLYSLVRSGNDIFAYINGGRDGYAKFSAITSSIVPSLLSFYLYVDIVFGEYRFYDRALTPGEVMHNYNIDKERFNLP